ncbi:MAG: response regulator [Pseudomonadales bacterium]|nr:response regulator [Pseudomonadales bacterium]NRA17035.1 response regulator [Oceanospirillaceae bacterium]
MNRETILIVDDSKLSRMVVRKFITQLQPDWQILEACDGSEALTKCEGIQIDWMSIDYNMPGMDGLTLASKLRIRNPEAQMALLTANVQDSIREQAEGMGLSFIQKPVTKEKIQSFVHSFIEG